MGLTNQEYQGYPDDNLFVIFVNINRELTLTRSQVEEIWKSSSFIPNLSEFVESCSYFILVAVKM